MTDSAEKGKRPTLSSIFGPQGGNSAGGGAGSGTRAEDTFMSASSNMPTSGQPNFELIRQRILQQGYGDEDDEESFEYALEPEEVNTRVPGPPTPSQLRSAASLSRGGGNGNNGLPYPSAATRTDSSAGNVAGNVAGNNAEDLRARIDSAVALSTGGVASSSQAASVQRAPTGLDGLQLFRVEDDNATFAPLPTYFSAQKGESEADGEAGKLGTIMGVYLPCVQNILGVILFLRLSWIVGHAGIFQACMIILVCATATTLTALSMSAIATNGKVPAGGAYYLISRALGPEFGGAVGILFYLGTTFAGAMYVLGGVEALKVSFEDMELTDNFDFQIFGLILLVVLALLVFVGVKYVNMAAMPFLGVVIIAVVAIIVGLSTYKSSTRCVYVDTGELYTGPVEFVNETLANATGTANPESSPLFPGGTFGSGDMSDPVRFAVLQGVPAATADPEVAAQNETAGNATVPEREIQCIGMKAQIHKNNVGAAFSDGTSFQSLIALFFPSVTGIMAGSNRSGVLANPGGSIPKGTLAAIATTTAIYLLNVILFGSTVPRDLLKRDEYLLVSAIVGWPSEWVVRTGIFLSTVGAALQSLTGAPMLLQAIANDDLIPALKFFSGTNQPRRALYLTTFICACAVLLGNIDAVAPVITMFFLLCYAFVNLACFLLAWLRDPNFRPAWRLFHWSTALVGLLWCVALMLFISWYFALIAIVIAAGVYKYIEFRGVDADWGDGLKGLSYQNALGSLLKLDAIKETHSKNWKPQILALVRMSGTGDPELVDERILSFVRQLKKGRGLNMFAHVISGNTSERAPAAQNARYNLLASLRDEGLEGFVEVVVASDFAHGVNALVQTAGLGGLKPNTVLLGFPESWKADPIKAKVVADTVNSCRDLRKAIVLMRGVQHFPGRSETLASTIDIWWIVHDGGMLLLLATLLQRKKEWRHTRVRVFSVARSQDNPLQLKEDIKRLLTALRMEGSVEDPVELDSTEVSAFTYERTMEMNKRRQLSSALRAQLANASGRNEQEELIEGFERTVTEQHISENDETVRSLDTAVKLNKHIVERSSKASVVILNLPPPKVSAAPDVYMEYLDALSHGITRCLLVRGSGREVVTMNA